MTNAGGIYKIELCDGRGRVYVGSATNFVRRWDLHRSQLRRQKHHSIKLQRAWDKYGEAAFSFSVVEHTKPEALIEREQFWMDLLCGHSEGFNVSSLAWRCTVTLSPESIEKRSAKLRGRKRSPEAIKKTTDAKRGTKMSEEQKQKLSAALKGRPRPAHLVEATAKANRGRKRPQHVIDAVSAAKKGVPMSAEQKAKLSISQRARFARERAARAAGGIQ